MREVFQGGSFFAYDTETETFECSNCGEWFAPYAGRIDDWNYCPICGCFIDGRDNPGAVYDEEAEKQRALYRKLSTAQGGLHIVGGSLSQLAKALNGGD